MEKVLKFILQEISHQEACKIMEEQRERMRKGGVKVAPSLNIYDAEFLDQLYQLKGIIKNINKQKK